MSTLIVKGKKELQFYVVNLVYLNILFAFVISVMTILDLLDIFSFGSFSFNEIVGNSSDLNVIDNNFALLPSFFGIIGVIYLLKTTASKLHRVYLNILLIVFSFNIILSGSRRGLIILGLIFLILAVLTIIILYKKNNYLKDAVWNCRFYILSLSAVCLLLSLFFLYPSYEVKNEVLRRIGTKNAVLVKHRISYNLFRCISVFNDKLTLSEFQKRIWSEKFVPEDPDSGWGNRFHKTIFPLEGKNAEIVPDDAKGYLMDNTTNASYYPTDDISASLTILHNIRSDRGDHYKASVYCFVSDSFNVNSVYLGVPDDCVNNNLVSGKAISPYNLDNKGIWQKLEVDFIYNEGTVPLFLSFWKRGIKDFSNLKGHIIFAYPQYGIVNTDSSGLSYNSRQGKSELQESRLKTPFEQYYLSGIFCFAASDFIPSSLILNATSPFSHLITKLSAEDTTYYPYKTDIVLNGFSNPFIEDRALRWEFALKIFSSEYTWKQKLFGGGFNFLNWFGYFFRQDKTSSDYPHNPFLSILLYSGIFGLAIYILFIYKVFYYYIKYFKEYKILAAYFIVTFFFSFFSAGSPFDPPIMGFFGILPFFIHSIHKKSNRESN
jgi:hypothetical protein